MGNENRRRAHSCPHKRQSFRQIAPISFHTFYRDLYGSRWDALQESLLLPPCYFELNRGMLKPYHLDKASVSAAGALDVRAGHKVLDLCAAPGGKTLVLSLSTPQPPNITANEFSSKRRLRLKKVLKEHLPEENLQKIRVTGKDASLWFRYEKNAYDRVLLDAPCSSERHVLASPAHLAQWSPSRIRRLAIQQFAMLASAMEAVMPGGEILYCTCALAPDENDGVIKKLFKKRSGLFEILPSAAPEGEASEYGWQILPDTCGGQGPIYFCRIRRTA